MEKPFTLRPAAATSTTPTTESRPDQLDAVIAAILDRRRAPDELPSDEYRAKEHAVGALFATFTAVEALAMEQRLAAARADDPIVARFARMVPERRGRLLAFLVQVRRRAAHANDCSQPRVAPGR